MRRVLIIACALGISLLVGACEGAGKPDLERTITTVPAREANAKRAVDRALKNTNARAPRATIFMLWRRMQQGVTPLASNLYAQRVQEGLGLPAVQGGLLAQTSFFDGYAPRVSHSEPTSLGPLLTVVATAPAQQPVHASYLLVREGSEWRITFDTVLEQGLDAYARWNARQSTDPSRRARADAQGAALAERYRLLTREPKRHAAPG
jgi:hypothetical protein